MINIENISNGWLDLTIGNKKYTLSYLHDVLFELEEILTIIDFDYAAKRLTFDCEGTELSLTSFVSDYDECTLYIIWEEHKEDISVSLLKFPYYDFKKEFYDLKEKIMDNYNKNFLINYGIEDDDNEKI